MRRVFSLFNLFLFSLLFFMCLSFVCFTTVASFMEEGMCKMRRIFLLSSFLFFFRYFFFSRCFYRVTAAKPA